MKTIMFFKDWSGIVRVIVVGTFAYAAVVLILRLFGKRMLAKMSAFDFVVTIALGSALASMVLDRSVPLAEGVSAVLLLCTLQWVVTRVSVHSRGWREFIRSEPKLLVFRGQLLKEAMHAERMTEKEVHAALRGHGLASPEEAGAVVLETDGSISVIATLQGRDLAALKEVAGFPKEQRSEKV